MKIKWTKIFDWSIVDVTAPTPLYSEYKDRGKILTGYEVAVTYRYHGTEKCIFGVDNDKFYLASSGYALRRACGFYEHCLRKIRENSLHEKTK